MYARKLMIVMAAFAAGFASLGFVLAEDSKPSPNPPYPTIAQPAGPQPSPLQAAPLPYMPAMAPPTVMANGSAISASEALQQQLKQLERSLKPGEQMVLLEAKCAQLPASLCEEIGLTGNPAEIATNLSRRETKMLDALLRAYPYQPMSARPLIVLPDGQSGFLQAVGSLEAVTGFKATDKDGKTVDPPKKMKTFSSFNCVSTLELTPKINKEKGDLLLRIESQITEAGDVVSLSSDTLAPSANMKTVQMTVKVASGECFATGFGLSKHDTTNTSCMFWILTPYVIRGKP
jgi:Bacterial type II and III secretion system protein